MTEKASALAGMFLPNYAPGMRTDRTMDHYKELTARWTAALVERELSHNGNFGSTTLAVVGEVLQ